MGFKKTKSSLKGSLGNQQWFFYGIALRKYYFGICMTFFTQKLFTIKMNLLCSMVWYN